MYKVLLVDDDINIINSVKSFLTEKGYEVFSVTEGKLASNMIKAKAPDCVVLDVGLPDESGIDVCRDIREISTVPVIFLSGFFEDQDKINGLLAGADDYLAKPFNLTELELRIKANISRGGGAKPEESFTFGDIYIDCANLEIIYGKEKFSLSKLEFSLLYFLARNPDRAFSYEQLYTSVWNEPINKGVHNIQTCMARVRQKLSELCPGSCYIENLRGFGYRFNPDGIKKEE